MATRRQFLSGAAAGVFAVAKPIRPEARGAIGEASIAPAIRGGASLLCVKSVSRREETLLRLGGIGDNWHMSWAADDRQYVSLCDGFGWPGMPGYDQVNSEFHARLYASRGNPPHVTFDYFPGYPEIKRPTDPTTWRRMGDQCSYYALGTLALDGRVYQYLSTRNHEGTRLDGSALPEPWRFVGAKLIYSPDDGRTWCNQNGSTPVVWEGWHERSRDNMVFFKESQDAFSLLSILQMGKNYENNRDGYVYVYAPNGSTEGTMNELMMLRIPKDRILHRSAYEYFAGWQQNGDPRWIPDIDARVAVCTFPRGWVNKTAHPWAWIPSVAHNAALGLYMMVTWGMGSTAKGSWFGKPSYLGLWVAETPWGPWNQVHEETAWLPGNDSNARAYSPQIAPKWIAADGKSFWLVWTDIQSEAARISEQNDILLPETVVEAKFTAEAKKKRLPYYAFNAQRVDILTA